MEILKGTLVAGLWGYLVSLVLAFLLAVVFTHHLPESDIRSAVVFFSVATLTMSFKIGVVLVPVVLIPCLVYNLIRLAVRQGVQEGVLDAADPRGLD